ncbi:thioredoxin domain-containing protein [Candidatus Daviesbacteria bacterium]|nr:thioredoxin domain-containing protein [Candidatus Daviesbacteria bacterium]
MNSAPKINLSTPVAIVIGAVLISIAILFSNGTLKFNLLSNAPKVTTNTTSPSYSEKLIALAKEAGLNESRFESCLEDGKQKEEVGKDQQAALSAGISGTPGFIVGATNSSGEIEGVRIGGAFPYETFQIVFDSLASKTLAEKIVEDVVLNLYPDDEVQREQVKKDSLGVGKANVDDDPVLGSKDAPITMIEFSDYECPFCKRHFIQTLPNLIKNYIDTGKVKLVYRDFIAVDGVYPQGHNPAATNNAVAANCAMEQGGDSAYFKVHDLIFNKTQSNGVGI